MARWGVRSASSERRRYFIIHTICECKKLKWIQLQQLQVWVSPPPLECPLCQPTSTEWQCTIHRSLPPSQSFVAKWQKQPLRWLDEPPIMDHRKKKKRLQIILACSGRICELSILRTVCLYFCKAETKVSIKPSLYLHYWHPSLVD